MAIHNPYQAYQQNSVIQSTPGELTLMLYTGCIKFLNQAKKGIELGNIDMKNININKAQNIIKELIETLNPEIAISETMLPMYQLMNQRLIEAKMNNDLEIIEEVIGYTTEFRDTWKQVVQMNRQKQFGNTDQI